MENLPRDQVSGQPPAPTRGATLSEAARSDYLRLRRRLLVVEWAAALLLTLTVVLLLAYRAAHAGGLWRDECAIVQLARMPTVGDIARNFQFEAFPIPYPLWIRGITNVFGTSDLVFRTYGFLVGVLLVGALWVNARLNGREVPLLSVLLLGLNPTFLVWGTTMRGYGTGSIWIVLTCAFFARMLEAPSKRAAACAALTALLAVHCVLYNSFLLFALGISAAAVCAFRGRWRTLCTVLIIGMVCAASMLPYARSYMSGNEWNILVKQQGASLGWVWSEFGSALGGGSAWVGWVWKGVFVALFLGLFLRWRQTSWRPVARPADVSWFALGSVVLGITVFSLFLFALRYIPRPWYCLPLISVMAACLDLLFVSFRSILWARFMRLGMAAVAIAVLPLAVLPELEVRQTSIDQVASRLNDTVDKDDFVLVQPWCFGVSFGWYYHGAAPWSTLPPLADYRTHRYDLLKSCMTVWKPVDPVLESMSKALKSGHRVWIVGVLPLLKEGQEAECLAPVPWGKCGWSEGAYTKAWASQAAFLIQEHAVSGEKLFMPDKDAVNLFEWAELCVVEGWRAPESRGHDDIR